MAKQLVLNPMCSFLDLNKKIIVVANGKINELDLLDSRKLIDKGLRETFSQGERSIENHFRECLDKKSCKGLPVAWNDQQVSVASGLDGIGAEGEGQRPCSPTGHRSAPLGNTAAALSSPLLSCLLFIGVFFPRFRVQNVPNIKLPFNVHVSG